MTGLPDTSRSQAVLIGVGHYQKLPDIAGVHHNLSALAEELQDERIWGLPSRNCVIVEDPNLATDILVPLVKAAQEATDTLVVYYAGHAFLDPVRAEIYLALVGSDPDQLHTGVPYRRIHDLLLGSRADRKILILDGIYSRGPSERFGSLRARAAVPSVANTYLLVSMLGNLEISLFDSGLYTPFTGKLIWIIRHGLAGRGPLLDLDSIGQEMRTAMQANGFDPPLIRNGHILGQLALIRNRGFQPPAPREPYALPSWWDQPTAPQETSLTSGVLSSKPDPRPTSRSSTPIDMTPIDMSALSAPRLPSATPAWQGKSTTRAKSQDRTRRRGSAGDWVSDVVQSAVQRGLLVFNPPEEMRQGRTDRVEVGIARSASLRASLLDQLHGRGVPQIEEIDTASFMSVELKGDAFQITPYSAPEQVIAPIARWEFDVIPIRAGVQTIMLCICLRIAMPQSTELRDAQRSVPVLERAIRIRVDVPYGTRRFLAGNWQWLVATAIGLGSGLAAWIALVH